MKSYQIYLCCNYIYILCCSLNSFSVFGGSPHFQSIGVPGPLTFSFTQNNSGSGLGSCNDLTEGACGPPKIFPSQQSPQKEPPNGYETISLKVEYKILFRNSQCILHVMSLDEERVLMYCFPFYPPSNLTLASFKPFISQFIINDNFIIIIIYIYYIY